MAGKNGPDAHHIVPNPKRGWNVKRGGAERATSHHQTKREAIDEGREVSRTQETELRSTQSRREDKQQRQPQAATPIRRKADLTVKIQDCLSIILT